MYIKMAKAEILIDQTLSFKDGKFVAYVKVLKVSKSKKFPEDSDFRISIEIKSYVEAIEIFLKQVERLMNHENE